MDGTSGDDTLIGTAGAETINGLEGNDIIVGNGGADTISGGEGNDHITVSFGATSVVGDAGDDHFLLSGVSSGLADTQFDGGSGLDIFDARNVAVTGGYLLFADDSFSGGTEDGSFRVADNHVRGVEVIFGGYGPNHFLLQNMLNSMTLHGGDQDDSFATSFDYADVMYGYGGDDHFLVRPGDTAFGGAGNDSFELWISQGGLADGEEGIDTLDLGFGWTVDLAEGSARGPISGSQYTVANIENVTVHAWQGYATSVSGDELANTLSVNPEWNDGSIGVVFDGRGGNDRLVGSAGEDDLSGGEGNDSLRGGAGDDALYGGAGRDVLAGDSGADTMAGGVGDDIYVVDDAADLVVEAIGEGGDELIVAATYSLAAGQEIERIYISEGPGGVWPPQPAALGFTGNEFSQMIFGNEAANVIDGAAGHDQIDGRSGDDTLMGADGYDTLTGADGDDRLLGGAGYDTLRGGDGADTLEGGADDDQMIGGSGADMMLGGAGDDHYFVDSQMDRVFEGIEEGVRDVVFATGHYSLLAGGHVEVLSTANWVGADAIDLAGNELDQEIYGNAGSNQLSGNGGADRLFGFGGNDTYFVDGNDDVAHETAGEGVRDVVFASGTHSLAAGSAIEILSTSDWSSTAAIALSGNELDQEIYGNGGANILSGGGGADSMWGMGGNDIYHVDGGDDIVREANDDGARDIVFASGDYGLASGSEVEILSTSAWGSTVAVNLTGNDLAQEVYGNDGVNLLSGGGGADQLYGFAGTDRLDGGWGADVLTGGAGADVFVFQSLETADAISDFEYGFDKIDLGGLIAPENFHFIGADSFSGRAGEARFSNGVLELDGNADGIADFAVRVYGSVVEIGDFVFTG